MNRSRSEREKEDECGSAGEVQLEVECQNIDDYSTFFFASPFSLSVLHSFLVSLSPSPLLHSVLFPFRSPSSMQMRIPSSRLIHPSIYRQSIHLNLRTMQLIGPLQQLTTHTHTVFPFFYLIPPPSSPFPCIFAPPFLSNTCLPVPFCLFPGFLERWGILFVRPEIKSSSH